MVLFTEKAWPYNATDDFAVVLVRRRDEPPHLFDTAYRLHVRRWYSSPAVVNSESFGRDLIPHRADANLATAGSSHFSSLPQSCQPKNMDVEALMEMI